eukprot:14852996-Ditylum_brightwellii.AAC.1
MQGNIRLKILHLLSPQWRAKCAKPNMSCNVADKVTAAFNKAKKNLKKQRKEKEVELNAFNKF